MPVGLLTLEIHLPYAHSLKEKRMVVQRLRDRLRRKFNVAVAELDHQDLWQRAVLGWPPFPAAKPISARCCAGPSRKVNTCWGGDLVDATIEIL